MKIMERAFGEFMYFHIKWPRDSFDHMTFKIDLIEAFKVDIFLTQIYIDVTDDVKSNKYRCGYYMTLSTGKRRRHMINVDNTLTEGIRISDQPILSDSSRCYVTRNRKP